MDHSYAVRLRLAISMEIARRQVKSCSFGMLLERFQQSGPATIDVLAHRLASFGAHLLEFAVFEFDAGCARAVGNESHLDLGANSGVWLPPAVDVPGHHETLGRLPHDNLADIRARAVFGQFVPMAAEASFHDGRLSRRLADPVVERPPASH